MTCLKNKTLPSRTAWLGNSGWLCLLITALLLAQAAAAQRPGDEAAAITAARLLPGERLPLDGSLSHPAWQRAPVHRDFVEKAPNTGALPQHETRVQVLFDEAALYVGIDALDPVPALIRAPLVRHDGVNRTQDFVVVYIDAIGSRQSAQFFRVNAAGSLADGMHTAADDSEDFAPDFDFDAATARSPTGYTAVFRLPFASLRFASDAGGNQPWRIMVARRVPREQFYLQTSVLVPRDAPSFIATLQPLQGVQLPERHQFLSLRPSLTWRRQTQQDGSGPQSVSQRLEASLDLKWRPLAEWVIDATLNPDFSQVALDVPQLAGNTRFALSFPETRPFFFESSDLLRSPTEALYSRSFTAPRWGLRSTWRGARLAGSAFAIDDRGGGLVLLPGPYGTDVAEQPASRSLVARLRGDADAQGAVQWGVLASARRYADDRGDNQVLGPDLAWQIDGAWRLRAQWLQSATSAQPQAGTLQRDAASHGHKAHAKLWYQSPQWEAELALDDSSDGFRNDSGFVVQSGVRSLKARLARGWVPLGPFNEFWFNLEGEQVRNRQTHALVSQDVAPRIWLAGERNLEAWVAWHGASALRTSPGGPLLRQAYVQAGITLTPAPWVPLLQAELQRGLLADVSANQVLPGGKLDLKITTRPLSALELEPSLSHAWLNRSGSKVYREAVTQLLARWHLGARQSLRLIVQHSTLDREAVRRSADSTGSLTYAWRQSAGSVLYIGAARSRQGVDTVARGNELFIKLQLDADDARRWF